MNTNQLVKSLRSHLFQNGRFVPILAGGLVLFGLYLTTFYHFLLFHTLAEIFSIIVACAIFMIAWNSRQFLQNNYLLFIGIAYLFVGGLDLIHTLAYKGMNIFRGYETNLPTQLWIVARYMESLSLFVAPFFFKRKLKPTLIFLAYAVTTLLLLVSIFYWNIFPVCFIEGTGLTPFKKMSEYIISTVLLASMFLLLKNRREFDKRVLQWVVWSIITTIFSELSFTFYIHAYGFSNMVGHFLKIVSFYLIYKAIIQTGLTKPYDLLFRNLKQREETLRDRTAQLEDVNKELEAFSYSVSHDLRGPLRNIDGFSQILLEDYGNKLDGEGREALQRIRNGAQRMAQLIDDLLKLSRVTRGEMQRETMDLSAMAKEIVEEFQVEPERGVECKVAEGVIGNGDGRLIRVVLENLLGNAWKFTSKQRQAIIEFGIIQHDGQAAYFVRDNGVGFDMAYSDKLFGAFQRLHGMKEFPGTGIGLATVQRIIHRHGGKVWAEGSVGQGATFYFTLPLRRTNNV